MIHRLMLVLSIAVCLMSGLGTTAYAATSSTYTITIPSTLDVQNAGWNELTGGISAVGTLESGKALVITASSDNGFKFVNSDDNTQTVSYDFRASSTAATAITTWKFDSLSTDSTAQTAGIYVDDYTNKPGGTYTETVTFTAEIKQSSYEAQDGDTLTGSAVNNTLYAITKSNSRIPLTSDVYITVADGAAITLNSMDITTAGTSRSRAGITCEYDATIILSGNNIVRGGNYKYPGIHIASGKTLTIQGSGSLTASGNGPGAGIGAGFNDSAGNIVIKSGNITAIGGGSSAGIGGSYDSSCGNITISGGTITAWGGIDAAGIGSGYDSSCGNITISGGTITATGGALSPGIGTGNGTKTAVCESITITKGVTKVTATAGGGDWWSSEKVSIGPGDGSKCGKITIGGTVYWDLKSGSKTKYEFKNNGANILTQSTYTYEPGK